MLSRKILIPPHSSIADADCADILASAYEVLIHALLKTWNPSSPRLGATELVAFVQSVLENLPSTSSASGGHSTSLSLLGDLLVDLIWAVDMQLSEFLPDAKQLGSTAKNTAKTGAKDNIDFSDKKSELTPEQKRAEQLKAAAESDRTTLAELTRNLLVGHILKLSKLYLAYTSNLFSEQESC